MQETLAHVCQRGNSYKFLSECYYLPDGNLLKKVSDAAQNNSFFFELASLILPAVELDSLRIDFTRLFVGPFMLLAPPYGSIYLEDSRIMGESTIDVRNWYEKDGLNIVINDAPDHIAMELEFMYYLVVKQTQATKKGNLQDIQLYQQKQKTFLCSHLARWLPEFAKNVRENAQTEFYRKLARLTEIFIQKEIDTCSLDDARQTDLIGTR